MRTSLAPHLAPRVMRPALLFLSFAFVTGAPLQAQLATPSAAQLATSDSRGALVRGFEAIAVNPAALAMPDAPRFSLVITSGRSGLSGSPIGLDDAWRMRGDALPQTTRSEWAQRVRAAGGQTLDSEFDATGAAFTLGRFGAQWSVRGIADGSLTPDAAQLLLLSYDPRQGIPQSISLGDSEAHASVVSTMALSYAVPLPLRAVTRQAAVLGATVHFSRGHVLVTGANLGPATTSDPVQLASQFPVVVDGFDGVENLGSGVGLDLGAMWAGERVRVGLAARNVVNTFAWDVDALDYRQVWTVLAESDLGIPQFASRPLREAPPALRERVERLGFDPMAEAAVAWSATPALVLSGVASRRFGDAEGDDARSWVAAGLAHSGLARWLTLLAGAGTSGSESQFSAGVGLDWGGVRLEGAVARRTGEDDGRTVVGLTLGYVGGGRR